jgi:hypothetical protein
MIAPTGGFELSTAAPGGFGFVPLLKGPAGDMMVDDGLILEPTTSGNGSGADDGAGATEGDAGTGGLPLPLIISYVWSEERGLT